MRYPLIFLVVFVLAFLPFVGVADAQTFLGDTLPKGLVPCGDGTLKTPEASCQLCHLVALGQNLLTLAIFVAIIIATLTIVWGGFLYLTAGGDPGKISTAHGLFGKSLVGILIVLTAWFVVDTILKVLIPSNSEFAQQTKFGPWNQIICVDRQDLSLVVPGSVPVPPLLEAVDPNPNKDIGFASQFDAFVASSYISGESIVEIGARDGSGNIISVKDGRFAQFTDYVDYCTSQTTATHESRVITRQESSQLGCLVVPILTEDEVQANIDLTHDEALAQLAVRNVVVTSTSGPVGVRDGCSGEGCTSLRDISVEAMNTAINAHEECNCEIVVTGATESGVHSGDLVGSATHASGDKIDIDNTGGVNTYFQNDLYFRDVRAEISPGKYRIGRVSLLDGSFWVFEGSHYDILAGSKVLSAEDI